LRRSSRLVLLLGAFLAVLTFVVVLLLGQGGAATPPAPTAPTELATVVATVDVPLGELVTADMVSTKTLPVANRDTDALGDVSQAIGKIARRPIANGGQVHASDFVATTVQLSVPAGKRAFALEVNEKTGAGNLIFPGDYVDVIVTLGGVANPLPIVSVDTPNNDDPNKTVTGPAVVNGVTVKAPLLLQEIQVIGTLDAPAQTPVSPQQQGGAAPTPAPSGPVVSNKPKLLILAVTDAQAEALVFARTLTCGAATSDIDCSAAIDVVLRSPDDKGTTEATDGVILRTLFDKYGVLPPFVSVDLNAFLPTQP